MAHNAQRLMLAGKGTIVLLLSLSFFTLTHSSCIVAKFAVHTIHMHHLNNKHLLAMGDYHVTDEVRVGRLPGQALGGVCEGVIEAACQATSN